jgi:hypothetical protein
MRHLFDQVKRGRQGESSFQPGVQDLAREAIFGYQAADQDVRIQDGPDILREIERILIKNA